MKKGQAHRLRSRNARIGLAICSDGVAAAAMKLSIFMFTSDSSSGLL